MIEWPAARCPLPAARCPLPAARCRRVRAAPATATAAAPGAARPASGRGGGTTAYAAPAASRTGPGREDAYGGCHAPGADGEAACGGRGLGPSGLGSTAGGPRETSRTTRHGLTASLAASACHVVRGSPASRKGHRFGPGRR
ncbi:hypothetical protein SDIAM103S_02154 [Streptomyces diastaticus subsp. diastaticus]